MKQDESTQRILLLLKIDANNLFKRIKTRKSEYLEIFALRRTRAHFPMIFRNRYESITITELSYCGPELIVLLDEFYSHAEEMSWYLFETQDMPNTVENFILRKITRMEKLLGTLNMFLDAEMRGEASAVVPETDYIDQPEDPFFEEAPTEDNPQET